MAEFEKTVIELGIPGSILAKLESSRRGRRRLKQSINELPELIKRRKPEEKIVVGEVEIHYGPYDSETGEFDIRATKFDLGILNDGELVPQGIYNIKMNVHEGANYFGIK